MKLQEIINNINYVELYNYKDITINDFSIDSRTIKENDCFVAIVGEKFDGNDFLDNALSKKVSLVICSKITNDDILSKDIPIILVEDTIKALQELAEYKRSLYNIPVVAVTGSAGKTSVKDMIASVLSQKYNVLKTEGNFNNHIGLPLTILKLKDHNALVVEMGMNHFHEIEVLSSIAKPTLAVITNVGTAHIGILGSRENILKAKLEILTGLNGKLIINNDNDLLHKWNKSNKEYETITVGINEFSDIEPFKVNYYEDYSSFIYDDTLIKVPVSGEHYVLNALCALAVGLELNVSHEGIKNGIENFSLSKNRMELIKGKYTIIDDTYNANYDSMVGSLKYLNSLSGRKIAVLGDMLELGEYSRDIHHKVGEEINKLNIDIVITSGIEAKEINNVVECEKHHFKTNEEIIEYINSIKKANDYILIKASHGMNYVEIVKGIQ